MILVFCFFYFRRFEISVIILVSNNVSLVLKIITASDLYEVMVQHVHDDLFQCSNTQRTYLCT